MMTSCLNSDIIAAVCICVFFCRNCLWVGWVCLHRPPLWDFGETKARAAGRHRRNAHPLRNASAAFLSEVPVVAWCFAQLLRELEGSLPELRFVAFNRPIKLDHAAPAA